MTNVRTHMIAILLHSHDYILQDFTDAETSNIYDINYIEITRIDKLHTCINKKNHVQADDVMKRLNQADQSGVNTCTEKI